MVISHEYKMIFIKTKKVAGTSLEVFLSNVCGDMDIFTPIIPEYGKHRARNCDGFCNHISAMDVRQKIGAAIWNNYYKFTIERNPWDKVVSYYFMKKMRQNNGLEFDGYLKLNDWPLNYQYYCDLTHDRPKILVDRVLYYESLNSELCSVFERLGIPFSGTLEERAKSEYRAGKSDYREFYTKTQADIVRKAFAIEIEMHQYQF
jgi:hypothetical protein